MALALLLLLLAGNTIRNEKLLFEISLPEDLVDWERVDDPKSPAHFKLQLPDDEGQAILQLFVMTKGDKDLDAHVEKWKGDLEQFVPEPEERTVDKEQLSGQEWRRFNVRGGGRHLTWRITIRGKLAYVLYVIRSGIAIDDEDIEGEVGEILKTFRFLDPPPDAPKPTGPESSKPDQDDDEPSPAKKLTFEFWRLEVLKPKGLAARDPADFDMSERANGVIARFQANNKNEQSLCMIRIYAQRRGLKGWRNLDRVAETRLEEWKKKYPENKRQEPVIDHNKWKPPQWKKTIRMRLLAFGRVKELTRWHFAECRNGVQYQVEIFTTGAHGETLWKPQVDAFLAALKPLPK